MMGGSRLGQGKEEEEAAATMAPCREVGDGRYIEEICGVTSNPCHNSDDWLHFSHISSPSPHSD